MRHMGKILVAAMVIAAFSAFGTADSIAQWNDYAPPGVWGGVGWGGSGWSGTGGSLVPVDQYRSSAARVGVGYNVGDWYGIGVGLGVGSTGSGGIGIKIPGMAPLNLNW